MRLKLFTDAIFRQHCSTVKITESVYREASCERGEESDKGEQTMIPVELEWLQMNDQLSTHGLKVRQ